MPSILITGCSTGFGRVTALRFARAGWQVFATVRKSTDAAELQAAAGSTPLHSLLCDITNADEVAQLRATVLAHTPRLDVLVNNAGTAYPGPLELVPLADVRAQFEVNVIAHLAVTQAFLPALRAAQGIIFNVSSQGGKVTFPINGPYCASKFALEALSDALRIEVAPMGVRVVVLEPGSSPTAIWEKGLQRGDELVAAAGAVGQLYAPLIKAVRAYFSRSTQQGFPPEALAELIWRVAPNPRPQPRYALPASTRQIIFFRWLLPDAWWDARVRAGLKW